MTQQSESQLERQLIIRTSRTSMQGVVQTETEVGEAGEEKGNPLMH